MQDRYELIDSFPSSYAHYEISIIYDTIKGDKFNPCETLYEREDRQEHESAEDMIEDLAFNEQERLQFFLDAKSHFFNSRRVDSMRLRSYLQKKFDYDPAKIREFDDDKTSLFLMLFHETYKPHDNDLKDEFIEARCASHKFKEKRDRITRLEEQVDLSELKENLAKFRDFISSEELSTEITSYLDGSQERFIILIREEHKRDMKPIFSDRTANVNDEGVVYIEDYPVRENAIQFQIDSDETEVQVYRSVSSWEDTLVKLFLKLIDEDITQALAGTSSIKAKEIMEELKENTDDEEQDLETAGEKVQEIVSDNLDSALKQYDDTDTNLSSDFIEKRLNRMVVTGVKVDAENTTFEIHNENGIDEMMDEYEGIASSLAKSVSNATLDDITLYAVVPSNTDEDDEVVLENGEWYMSSNASESTMKALEAVL